MTLLEAYESGLSFKHKNWVSWHENKGEPLKTWIYNSPAWNWELFDKNWVIKSTKLAEHEQI